MSDPRVISFEEKVRLATAVPDPAPAFTDRLWDRLEQESTPALSSAQRLRLQVRPIWAAAAAFLLILVLLFFGLGPQRVYAEVAKILGYIPQVGLVAQNNPIRVLAEPVTLTRNGITLTVAQATLTDQKTVLVYRVENVPDSARSHDENVAGCGDSGYLVLANGTSLHLTDGWGSEYQGHFIYPAIPAEINDATFVLPCIFETLPGKAPENWQLPLHFVAAAADFTPAPVLDLPTPTPQTSSVATAQPTAASLYGIQIALDQVIPLTDGYYLIGHTDWTDSRVSEASPAGWNLKAYDARGLEVPLEPADWNEAGLSPNPGQWIYRLYGTNFNDPLTLRATQMGILFKTPVELTLDLRPEGFTGAETQIGQVWKNESIPFDIPGLHAVVKQVTYSEAQGGMKGFEIGIQVDPALQNLSLSFASGLDTTGLSSINGSADSNWDEASGLLLARVYTNASITFPLVLSAGGTVVNGEWETAWNPPSADTGVTPTPVPQACLTLQKWQQVLKNPKPLPQGLSGRVLISRGALAPNPSLFLANLDGEGEQGLVYGNGSLSANGAKLVYADNSGNIVLMAIQTGQKTALTQSRIDSNPRWSPDNRQIAFLRMEDHPQIYIMNTDGSDLKGLAAGADQMQLAGWAPDGQVLYWVTTADQISHLKLIQPLSGAITNLFSVQSETPVPVYSPDGNWIAFYDRVPGRMTQGVYVSHPDGSEKRLLIQLDYWSLRGYLSWSPGGNWLAFSAQDSESTLTATAGLINLETCQTIPLPGLDGAIQSWVGK